MTDARRKSASAPPFVRLAEDVDEERAIKQSATPPPAALAAAQQKMASQQKSTSSTFKHRVSRRKFSVITGLDVAPSPRSAAISKLYAISTHPATLLSTYYGVGCTAYYLFEGWAPLDTCYFLTVTATTVGYGDFSPTSPLAKLFTCGYALLGIIMIFDLIAAPVVSWLRGTLAQFGAIPAQFSELARPLRRLARTPPRARGVHPADERAVRAAARRAHRERRRHVVARVVDRGRQPAHQLPAALRPVADGPLLPLRRRHARRHIPR